MKRIIHYFPVAFVGILLLASQISSCALSVLSDEYIDCKLALQDGKTVSWYLWTKQNLDYSESTRFCNERKLNLVDKGTAVAIANSKNKCGFNNNWTTWTIISESSTIVSSTVNGAIEENAEQSIKTSDVVCILR